MMFNTGTKIFLWICFIAGILKIVMLFTLTSGGISILNMTNPIFIINLVILAASVAGYAMLLFLYKKMGFYLMTAAATVTLVINILYGTFTLKVFSRTVLTVVVIYYLIRGQWEELE